MNFKTILAPAVALTMALANPLQAKAEMTPYSRVVSAMSFSACLIEYGRTREQAERIFEAALHEFPKQQVMNIVSSSQFLARVKRNIKSSGGCGVMVRTLEDMAAKKQRTPGI